MRKPIIAGNWKMNMNQLKQLGSLMLSKPTYLSLIKQNQLSVHLLLTYLLY